MESYAFQTMLSILLNNERKCFYLSFGRNSLAEDPSGDSPPIFGSYDWEEAFIVLGQRDNDPCYLVLEGNHFRRQYTIREGTNSDILIKTANLRVLLQQYGLLMQNCKLALTIPW